MKIKLVGKYNDLELGTVDDQDIYRPTGLLNDPDHVWKILHWIDVELQSGYPIRIVKEPEDMMAESQRKNKEALDSIVKGAFRNSK